MKNSKKLVTRLISQRKRQLYGNGLMEKKISHPPFRKIYSRRIRWIITGASVAGAGHKLRNTPCQDAHQYQILENGWGIAVVSDGAGSAAYSQVASAFLVQEAVKQARYLITRKTWMKNNDIPAPGEWDAEAKALMYSIQDALLFMAEKQNIPRNQLHATLILLIFSPSALMCVHIGDGRAGYVDINGHYDSLMTPFTGEQAGETAFITIDLNKYRQLIETKMVKTTARAFFLLTDGCEKVCWETLHQDRNEYIKLNKPFIPFFQHTIEALNHMHNQYSADEININWQQYLDSGHKGFISESDDKTLLIGIRH
jgi:hypothetical protein